MNPILSRVKPASEIPTTPKFLLVGEHGSGKTHTMATFHTEKRKMLAVVFEGGQSISTIQQAAPSCGIFKVDNVADWRLFCKFLISGELAAAGYSILGIDSFTAMQTYYANEFDEMQKIAAKAAAVNKNKYARFDFLKTNMGNIFMFIRDLPMIAVATVRAKPENDEDSGTTSMRISLDGAARFDLGAHFSATAHIYKIDTDSKGNTRRGAMFSGCHNYTCREFGPLRGVCVPDGDLWMRALSGEDVAERLYLEGVRLPDERKRGASVTSAQDVAI